MEFIHSSGLPVLLLADDGLLQKSLHVLLASNPEISEINLAYNLETILSWIETQSKGLVIIDLISWITDSPDFIKQIKSGSSTVGCIVIATSFKQIAALKRGGADGVLLSGFDAKELFTLIHTYVCSQLHTHAS
jgi:DNA-binding NarL/FixJ family response regulator